MAASRQNPTLSLDRATLGRARALAARDGVSISALVARELERLVDEDDAYGRSEREALSLLETGFHLGGRILARREDWHQRP